MPIDYQLLTVIQRPLASVPLSNDIPGTAGERRDLADDGILRVGSGGFHVQGLKALNDDLHDPG